MLVLLLAGAAVAGCLRMHALLEDMGALQQAPATAGTDADGAPLRLEEFRGKVALLAFWHAA
jgi:hypothetical protein